MGLLERLKQKIAESQKGIDDLSRPYVNDPERVRELAESGASAVGSIGPIRPTVIEESLEHAVQKKLLPLIEKKEFLDYLRGLGAKVPASGQEFIEQAGNALDNIQIKPEPAPLARRAVEKSLEALDSPQLIKGRAVADEYDDILKGAKGRLKALKKE